MANSGNKKIIVKKDMNFFAEFTASAAKAARLLTYAVLFGIAVVGIILVFIVIGIVRNTIIKGQITDLENQLASDEYANLEVQASALAETLKTKNNYFYALCMMRKNVDETPAVSMDLPDVIADVIPSDSYLVQYQITGTQLAMEGYSFSYYSPVDMVNMLNEAGVFKVKPDINTARVSATEIGSPEEFFPESNTVNAINNYYNFTIVGTLVSDVYVSIERIATTDTVESISGIETIKYDAGSIYTIEDIATYEAGGISYNLTSITINGVGIDEESFNNILNADAISGVANDNVDIALYYTSAVQEEAAEEAEQ
ncbi:MAG: hypothetical protein J5776_06115 [Clostridiales bacterium]|nr:hypothetical protein [Clostridiales bacterium]